MAMEDHGEYKIKAAAIARDITAAFATGGSQNASWFKGAKEIGEGLALVYETVHAAAMKSLRK